MFGLIMGGSDLNDDYEIKKCPQKVTTQLRTPKQSILVETYPVCLVGNVCNMSGTCQKYVGNMSSQKTCLDHIGPAR